MIEILKSDYAIFDKIIDLSIVMKKEQVNNEPNEPMWKNELMQLYGTKEIIEEDKECMYLADAVYDVGYPFDFETT